MTRFILITQLSHAAPETDADAPEMLGEVLEWRVAPRGLEWNELPDPRTAPELVRSGAGGGAAGSAG